MGAWLEALLPIHPHFEASRTTLGSSGFGQTMSLIASQQEVQLGLKLYLYDERGCGCRPGIGDSGYHGLRPNFEKRIHARQSSTHAYTHAYMSRETDELYLARSDVECGRQHSRQSRCRRTC